MKLIPYTKEEKRKIIKLISNNPTKEQKQELADELKRSVSVIAQKALYEKKMKKQRRLKAKRGTEITVTHLEKKCPVVIPATIKLSNNVVIEIPTNKFKIDGVELIW